MKSLQSPFFACTLLLLLFFAVLGATCESRQEMRQGDAKPYEEPRAQPNSEANPGLDLKEEEMREIEVPPVPLKDQGDEDD